MNKIYYKAFIIVVGLLCATSPAYAYTYDQLLSMLHNADAYTRGMAAQGLGDSGDQAAGPVLLHALTTDASTYVQGQAARALGKLNYQKAIPDLIHALFERKKDLTGYAAEALGQLKAQGAVVPLERVLNNTEENENRHTEESTDNRSWLNYSIQDRSNAADALGRIGDQKAANALIKNLQDPNYIIRLHCVLALGALGNPASYDAVKALLNDANPRIQDAAKIALNAIPPPTTQQTNYYNSLKRADYSKYQTVITRSVFNPNSR